MTLLTPGIHFDVPFQDYLADPGINQSELKKFGRAKSPAHYLWDKDHPDDKEPVHFKIGRFVESIFFRRGTPIEHGLTVQEETHATGCILSLLGHTDAVRLRDACNLQVAVIGQGPPRRKGMIDMLPDPARCDPLLLDYVIDLKTGADAGPEGFRNACYKFGYHVQAAYYMDLLEMAGRKVSTFVFIVVETRPTYAVAIHYMPRVSVEVETGRSTYTRWLKDYSACLEKEQWPGYGSDWSRVQFKPWQLRDAYEPERIV